MDGKEIVRIIESELFSRGISKGEFYEACGMNSATLSNWRNGVYSPSSSKLNVIEDYLGIKFSEKESSQNQNGMDEETAELLERYRTRQDYRTLFKSIKDVPPSSIYEIVSKIEKMKEDAEKL